MNPFTNLFWNGKMGGSRMMNSPNGFIFSTRGIRRSIKSSMIRNGTSSFCKRNSNWDGWTKQIKRPTERCWNDGDTKIGMFERLRRTAPSARFAAWWRSTTCRLCGPDASLSSDGAMPESNTSGGRQACNGRLPNDMGLYIVKQNDLVAAPEKTNITPTWKAADAGCRGSSGFFAVQVSERANYTG